jgi:hypothetical protein
LPRSARPIVRATSIIATLRRNPVRRRKRPETVLSITIARRIGSGGTYCIPRGSRRWPTADARDLFRRRRREDFGAVSCYRTRLGSSSFLSEPTNDRVSSHRLLRRRDSRQRNGVPWTCTRSVRRRLHEPESQDASLRLFPLDGRLQRILHAEDIPRASQHMACVSGRVDVNAVPCSVFVTAPP